MDLVKDLKQGNRRAIARAISLVENDEKEAKSLVKKIFKSSGKSITIGITGPAGAGKSTLINKTSIELNKLGYKTAVLAIDPTSHITGGAILGDRVRMTESTDSGTYIRSMASRGATGAVSLALRNSIRVLEFSGFNPIIIESVGAGQTEVDISRVVDVTIVVFNPNTGDNIQTIKAGLTEIGDIYLINKSDLSGANQLFDSVRDFIGMSEKNPTVMMTSAKSNKGITEFAKKLKELMESQKKSKKQKEEARLDAELKDIILNNVKNKVSNMLDSSSVYAKYLKKVQKKDMDPFEAADKMSKLLK
ncbi:putative periplasmic protein kinase ArgK [Candidatus Nitrosotalea sp. TS]|uniref:methylmalonyl Co-A mutase-associated GTPase MeaB n=1 Tax=Candidatus Nitrosotalea sp. TS TaxID=2341020 RepID=UPI00140B50C4|nr:methylmalonyl Co-A mutase-associated GTPase MeaB [Candidatus Nitrosotalea sp. TS]NHI02477.1 putative periplasmic protein kinase ArgK [Candidatus Nitrosotalea sp. TS]